MVSAIRMISKHLMLLFIWEGTGNPASGSSFQNISCYCLSFFHCFFHSFIEISKHLMLLFISAIDYSISWNYKISKHLMLLFIYTTHCTIYNVFLFQNISCYCLSLPAAQEIAEYWEFQNISCYCLSMDRKGLFF